MLKIFLPQILTPLHVEFAKAVWFIDHRLLIFININTVYSFYLLTLDQFLYVYHHSTLIKVLFLPLFYTKEKWSIERCSSHWEIETLNECWQTDTRVHTFASTFVLLSLLWRRSSMPSFYEWLSHTHYLSRFHIYALIYDICFCLSDLLHSIWQSLGPSMSLQMTQFVSFLMGG